MKRFATMCAAALLASVAPAQAAPKRNFAPSRSQGRQALTDVARISRGKGVETGRELTPVLAQLNANLPALSGDDRAEATATLARPDDNRPDPGGTHKWDPAAVRGTPYETQHFKVHFVTTGPDATTASYAKTLGDILENEVYACENGVAPAACAGQPGLGWRDPAPDEGIGGNDKVDVYVEDLFTGENVFGYSAVDPGQDTNPSVPHHAYMVLDKDYSRFGDGTQEYARRAAEVTAAHEYNHVLQNAYDYLQDTWMFEATAVWMEDEVFPAANDYVRYVSAFAANPRQPLTTFTDANLKGYGSAVWNHWLDRQYGAGVVRNAWEQSIAAGNFAPGAYSLAIGGAGGTGFSDEFARFAAAVPEWNVPGIGFPDRYPDVVRDGILPVETKTFPFSLPHASFSLFDVPIPAGSPPTIRLLGNLPQDTAGAIALVGRTGTDPAGGTVTRSLTPMPNGGTAAVQLDKPSQFGRITAVVVNSDTSRSGFDQKADDWIWTKDATDVTVSMAAPGAPLPTTGVAGLISDHGAFVNATVDPHLIDTKWQIEYGPSLGYGSQTKALTVPASTVGAAAVVAPLTNLEANTVYHYRVLATNSAGVTAGDDRTFKTARDVTRPTVTLSVKKQRLVTAKRRGVTYRVRCSERCRGVVELEVSSKTARRLGVPQVIAKTYVTLNPTSRLTTRRVRFTRRASAVLGSGRGFTVRLVVNLLDDSRNRRIVTKSAALTRSTARAGAA